MTIFEDFIYPGVRITFAIFLVIAFLFYLAEFATDQSDDLGFWKTQWQIAITNLSGKYPGHKGEAGYIVLFVFNVLLTILGLASIYFCNLYWMVVPFAIGYIIVVSVDGHLLGTVYTNLGFWFGPCSIIAGCVAWLMSVIFGIIIYLYVQDNTEPNGDGSSNPINAAGAGEQAKSTKSINNNKKKKKKRKKKKPSPSIMNSKFQ